MLPQDPPLVALCPQRRQVRYLWRCSILLLHVPHKLNCKTLQFSGIFVSIEQIKISVSIKVSSLDNEVQVRQLTHHDSLWFCTTGPADLPA